MSENDKDLLTLFISGATIILIISMMHLSYLLHVKKATNVVNSNCCSGGACSLECIVKD